jgi:hypothetical protein
MTIRPSDGYEQAKIIAKDAVCMAGHELQVVWAREHFEAACVTQGCDARGIVPRHELERDRIRERLERDPQLATALAVAGSNAPLTSQALKGLSGDQMRTRVDHAFAGVKEATPEIRTQILAVAQLYGLDPLRELRLFQGGIYIEFEGWMRKRREHPNFRGEIELRPLTKQEKEEWGFAPGDVVIKNTIDMGPQGQVFDFGVVRAQGETSPVARQHPQLLAIKRARVRTARIATGIDLPTIIDIGPARVVDIQPIEKLQDGEASARRRFWAIARGELGLSEERVHELLRVQTVNGYPGGWTSALNDLTERAAESQVRPEPEPAPKSKSESEIVTVKSLLGQRLAELIEEASRLEVEFEDCKVEFGVATREEVIRKGERLRDRVEAKKTQLGNPQPQEVL